MTGWGGSGYYFIRTGQKDINFICTFSVSFTRRFIHWWISSLIKIQLKVNLRRCSKVCLSTGEAASLRWLWIAVEDCLRCLQNNLKSLPLASFLLVKHFCSLYLWFAANFVITVHATVQTIWEKWAEEGTTGQINGEKMCSWGMGIWLQGKPWGFKSFCDSFYHCSSNNVRQIISSILARILECHTSKGNCFNWGPKKVVPYSVNWGKAWSPLEQSWFVVSNKNSIVIPANIHWALLWMLYSTLILNIMRLITLTF